MTDKPKSYDELRDRIAANGDLETVTMGLLRDIHGAGKLGSIVRENITKELQMRGMTHAYGNNLPAYQDEPVRIWIRGTQVGDLFDAVHSETPEGDAKIREMIAGEGHDALLKIREIVCA